MCELIKLQRINPDTSWGFRLAGGLDFGTPLTVVKVTGGSIAEIAGVLVGDIITDINNQPVNHLTHTEAQNFIVRCGNRLILAVIRGTVVTPPPSPFQAGTLDCLEDAYHYENEADILYSDEIDYYKYEDDQYNDHFPPESIVSDLELDEVLTGNEEVLDQGIIGINFQKFIPQVDFIRHSEVFKVLQEENVKKEEPEEIILQKEPTKRFSTFLQKPKPPPYQAPTGPFWHYPKAPNYLPKKKANATKGKDCHSVLWLFLNEAKDHVVNERWGTPDEERLNESRNTNRDDEGIIMPAITSRPETPIKFQDSSRSAVDEIEDSVELNQMSKKLTRQDEFNNEEILEDFSCVKSLEDPEAFVTEEVKELINLENPVVSQVTVENDHEITESEPADLKEPRVLVRQDNSVDLKISEIQNELLNLGDRVPADLNSQLAAVQDQLKRILLSYQACEEDKIDEIASCESHFEVDNSEKLYDKNMNYQNEVNNEENCEFSCTEEELEKSQEIDEDQNIEDNAETEDLQIEYFERGDYDMCRTPGWPPTRPPPKKVFHPLTPSPRPIVLPGGRQWRKPKDAYHEEFYQGVLVEEAEVFVGTNTNVNFKKYVPPKFDTSHSHVFKLIQEIESKVNSKEKKAEDEFWQPPIDKRHFYLATLKEPEPVGAPELPDITQDV